MRRGNVGLQAHGCALRRRERDVGDVVGVVTTEERQQRVDNVEGEEQADEQNAQFTVRGVVDKGRYGGADG